MKLTQKILKELFYYDYKSGKLSRRYFSSFVNNEDEKKDRFNDKGHTFVYIDGEMYSARRLVWLYMTGEWPVSSVYSMSRDKSDLRWEVLTTERSESHRASVSSHASNTSGCVGVHYNKADATWVATITVKGYHRYLGGFKDKLDAVATRKVAELMGDDWLMYKC